MAGFTVVSTGIGGACAAGGAVVSGPVFIAVAATGLVIGAIVADRTRVKA